MTVPSSPDRQGRSQPAVPATFLAGGDAGRDGDRPGGWSLGALTGPIAAPVGGPGGPPVTRGPGRRGTPPLNPPGTELPPAPPPAPPARAPHRARTPRPGGAVRAADGGGAASTPAPASVRPAPALSGEDRGRLLAGTHRDPHSVLGARTVPDGRVRFRTLQPTARAVTVVAGEGGLRARLLDEGDGLFAGEVAVPAGGFPEYELLVEYGEAGRREPARVADPYRFPSALGELDVRLAVEGRHEQLWQALGAREMTHRGVAGTRFTVWAPGVSGVRVVGDFNCWDGRAASMRALGSSDVWELFLPGVGDGDVYKFEAVRDDGSRTLFADPMARLAEVPPGDGSVVRTSAHRWRDGDWLDRRGAGRAQAAPVSVYEVHLPSWRPGLACRELAEQLPAYVRDLGFTHVELLPCAEPRATGAPGHGVQGLFAPVPGIGDPDGLKCLVDALHRAGIGVIMAWAPMAALASHREPLEPGMRSLLESSAVYWCETFHLDGVRVDGVASLLAAGSPPAPEPPVSGGSARPAPEAVSLLQELNALLHRRCPGVMTFAEVPAPWDGVTRATHHVGESGYGGLGFDFTWDTAWMRGSLTYAGREPGQRSGHLAELTSSMSSAYAESRLLPVPHSQVTAGKGSLVSRMPGDRAEQFANHRAFLAFMWAHPGKQLLFMGQEFAQTTEWGQSHGPDWWLLDPSSPAEPRHRGVRTLVRDLNEEYLRTPALWQLDTRPAGFAWIHDGSGGPDTENVVAFLRFDGEGDPLAAVCNFSDVLRTGYRLGLPDTHAAWSEVLSTDELRYGGSGITTGSGPLAAGPVKAHGRPASVTLTLPPLTTVWLRPYTGPVRDW
ncbi:1,4-alpha-glucan branching enzyme [Streptomyces sp. WMMB 714]|uniref:GlgB N-terminal domain-containing protein n=1 Tax=Streptomyces sp. WMMB 714 TaxID=1286822 RepID=UPI000823EBD6|nr:alpha amylase C-terminal domain-containing protein [Streptomyces sp. WMMB 714]SCK35273.1 1,4-alpha-glucan branching enzyme [Streptomyces sp. WMMB 714]